MQDIQSWITESLLDAVVNDNIVTVKDVGNFLIIEDKYFITEGDREVEVVKSYFESYTGQKQERLFDDHFRLILNNDEIEAVSDESLDVKYFLFQFGERWYYCDDWEHPELNEFKYLGKAVKEIDTNFPFLGIHGGYDLCNGSRLYKDWCKKAKFLGINTLGIAEENTLAGTLDFQTACKEAGIKSIIGETVTVKNNTGSYPLKLYVQNEEGWRNLLRINAEINVHNGGYVTEEKLLLFSSGLICVISPEAIEKIALPPFQQHFPNRLYFQFDLVEWDNSDRDKKWLEWIKTYLTNGWVDNIAPVIISDAYYLDKQDSKIRRLLNKIGGVKFKYNSKNQWFKSLDEIFSEISEVFNVEDNRLYELFEAGVSNLNSICENIDFTIEKKPRLPKYKMTQQENEKYNGDTVSMIVDLIEDGFNKKISGKVNNEDTYLERIEYELDLFIKGDMINYFLILWDIVNWCSQNDILVGIGRGSAAGSLVAYCIGLVDVDPLKYGLMIERFINPSRIGIDNADIDTDVPSAKREDIKRYMERRYGVDYVVSIGTYSTFKMRGAITALARCFSIPSSTTKFITKKIDAESSFTDLFKAELSVKEYIKNFPMVIDNLPSLLNQPQTSSIHAAGIVIVPEEYGTVYEQLPVKKMDGSLVSEWEGNYIEKTGYLKCDLLGLNQLDKFIAIIDTIKQTTGKKVTFEQIDLEQTRVYDLLCDGYCNDVFQFGTEGLEGYCKKMKPSNINDLIAAVALYRPGAMESGGHEKYIKVKNGEEEPVYWYKCKEITEETYGIICYQEQLMKIVQVVGGLSPADSETVRKAVGKKIYELMMKYKDQFIEGAINNGCPPDEAANLWDAMESFANYSFNKSHAACYAITGYYSQWYKANYPLEFYKVALEFATKEEEKISIIAEIDKAFPFIKISPPDINRSKDKFTINKESNIIYWSMTVKYAGDVAINDIQNEIAANGQFFSFEEFIERTANYRSINIRVIKNLIVCGAFDEIEKITDIRDRYRLLKHYYDFRKTEFTDDIKGCKDWREHQWTMMQISLSGCGYINFKRVLGGSKIFASKQDKYKSISELLAETELDTEHVTAGVLIGSVERNSRNGKFVQLEIQDNSDTMHVTLWNDAYEPIKSELKGKEGNIIILSGRLIFDSYKNKNVIQSNRNTKIEFA